MFDNIERALAAGPRAEDIVKAARNELALMRRYFEEGEQAKNLLHLSGYGVTGTSLLESVKEILE